MVGCPVAILGVRVIPAQLGLPQGTRTRAQVDHGVSTATAHVGDPVGALVTVDVPAQAASWPRRCDPRNRPRSHPLQLVDVAGAPVARLPGAVPSSGAAIPIATRLVAGGQRARNDRLRTVESLASRRRARARRVRKSRCRWAAIAPELVDVVALAFDSRSSNGLTSSYGPGTDLELELTAAAAGVPVPTDARIEPVPAGDLVVRGERSRSGHGRLAAAAGGCHQPGVQRRRRRIARSRFVAAGWTTAVALGLPCRYSDNTGRGRGSRATGRSRVLRDVLGRPPDRVFQKQTNTFDRRHHVRIWRLPQRSKAGRCGSASATHDVGIKFIRAGTDLHPPRRDRHRFERQKIVDDLRFAGFVQASRSPSSQRPHPDGQRHRRRDDDRRPYRGHRTRPALADEEHEELHLWSWRLVDYTCRQC